MINYKTTDYLSDDAKAIREQVFIKEQKFVNEFDDTDNISLHTVMYDDKRPIACCRIYKGKSDGEYIAGRIAVIKEYRSRHLGQAMLSKIESEVRKAGGKKISVSAQLRAEKFYENSGFKPSGEVYFDEYCEHIHMEKLL